MAIAAAAKIQGAAVRDRGPERGKEDRKQHGQRHRDEGRDDGARDHLAQGDVRHTQVSQGRGLLQQRNGHRVARDAQKRGGNGMRHVLGDRGRRGRT